MKLIGLVLFAGIIAGCHSLRLTNQKIAETIEIQVNPGFLNLQNQGQVISVYTRLAYSDVVRTTITINGVSLGCWGNNNQGNYVAKFSDSTVRALTMPSGTQEFTVTLTGEKNDGTLFIGSSQLTILNNPSSQ
jgi:hypothetical protein